MQKKFLLVVPVILLVLFFSGHLFSLSTPSPKIAVADITRVLERSREVQEVHLWLKKKNENLEKKVEKYKVDLKNLEEQLKNLNPESKIYEELKWKRETKVLELKQYVLLQSKRLTEEYKLRLKGALEKVRPRIREYVKKQGYSLLFNIRPDSLEKEEETVFYFQAQIDLTQELIQTFQ